MSAAPTPTGRMDRMRALMEQYGRLAIFLHLVVWFACTGFFAAVAHFGLDALPGGVDAAVIPGAAWLEEKLGATGMALGLGYGATQVLKFPRFALTAFLTPLVARWIGRAPAAAPGDLPPVTPA